MLECARILTGRRSFAAAASSLYLASRRSRGIARVRIAALLREPPLARAKREGGRDDNVAREEVEERCGCGWGVDELNRAEPGWMDGGPDGCSLTCLFG